MDRMSVFFLWMVALASAATPRLIAFPANDNFADAMVLDGRPSDSVSGTNEGATREPGEPLIEGDPGGRSVWWRWPAPRSEKVTFHTFGSELDTLLGVYTGAAVEALTLVAENDDAEEGLHSVVEFEAVAGRVYQVVVDGVFEEDDEGVAGAASGSIVLSWFSGRPVNDDFDRGVLIQGPSGRTSGANFGATLEAGEPMVAGVAGGRSLWWRWTAPRTQKVTLHTVGSSFDTQLGVYTGSVVNELQVVVENDDIFIGPGVCRQPPCRRPPPPRTRSESRVDFEAVAGTLYHFVVDGYEGETGSIVLTWLPAPSVSPENDHFSSRVKLDEMDGVALGSNLGATTEAGEPDHAGGGGTRSVWWSWVAPGDGTATLSTYGSTFDTILAAYTGDVVDALVLVAENDDNELILIDDEISVVRFSVAGGTEYQIAVAGYEEEAGIVALVWSFSPGGGAPRFRRGDANHDGVVNLSDAVYTLSYLFLGDLEPVCLETADSDDNGTLNITDPVRLLNHLFLGGPQPEPPGPRGCGEDPLRSPSVGCEGYGQC